MGAETQVWSTNNGKVGDGTYLVWVEDVSNADLQGVRVELSGPGLNPSITNGPFRFKDLDDGVTEAQNLTVPYQQHVFLIQVQNGSIVRSDQIPVGSTVDALKNGLNAEIGNLPENMLLIGFCEVLCFGHPVIQVFEACLLYTSPSPRDRG